MLLAFDGVRKAFGGTQALNGVSAQVDGRAIGLLGPNGAGKTTLMRVCLGLIGVDAGSVRVLGEDVLADPVSIRRRLGFAAEGPERLPGLSGLESVALAAELCGLSRRKALLRAHEMLDLVGLDEARHRPVESYSTGMHQRVKVAMALVHDPELLLLDEPTSGLDPESRDGLLDLVVHLRDHGGPAIVLSTHLLHDVERTCDTCMIMTAGQVRYAGPLEELQGRHPSRLEVRFDGPPGWTDLLVAEGARVEVGRRPDEIFLHLGPALALDAVWQAAKAQGVRIWHLAHRAVSLEEIFMQAIHEGADHA
ncbi:MAG: ATP-binding cassette domain-containing protein [Bradymonadia bacterium]